MRDGAVLSALKNMQADAMNSDCLRLIMFCAV